MTDIRAALGAHRASAECEHCGAFVRRRHARDCPNAKRARSSGRLGKDQERRIEKLYGPTKVGEFNDAIDLLGRDWKWQAKSTRAAMPLYLAAVDAWEPIEARAWMATPIDHMAPLHVELRPLLIRSYVHQGVPVRDVIVVRSTDWAEMHGGPAAVSELMVMSGSYFLDTNGRDER